MMSLLREIYINLQLLLCLLLIQYKQVSVNNSYLLINCYYCCFTECSIRTQRKEQKKFHNTRETRRSVTSRVIWSSSRPEFFLWRRFWCIPALESPPPPHGETKSMNKNCCSCLHRVWRSFRKHAIIWMTAVASTDASRMWVLWI